MNSTESRGQLTPQGVFDHSAFYGLESLHFKHEHEAGLKAIIAIHDSSRGPALGGTRCLPYASESQALTDVSRLAQSMSYKSAFAGLPYGGGKAVILRPARIDKPDEFFESYGQFIQSLKGRYITAVDVGTGVEYMDIIARKTGYVLSTSRGFGDPSGYTAQGVLRGIAAAVNVHLNRPDLEGCRVAIQGVGKVGFQLARLLHALGAQIMVADINREAAEKCADAIGASCVAADEIIGVECEVFAPCAMGAVIDADSVNKIQAPIVCGAANNQMESTGDGDTLHRRKIFYVPDYVVNAGGLIHVVYGDSEETHLRIGKIHDAVIDIYQQAQAANLPSYRIANRIAEGILAASRRAIAR